MTGRVRFYVVLILCSMCVLSAHSQVISPKGAAGYTMGTFVADGLLRAPTSVEIDRRGNVNVIDAGNFVVRKFNAKGENEVIAGTPGVNQMYEKTNVPKNQRVAGTCYTPTGDFCLATQAILNGPQDAVFYKSGHIFIADTYASKIRKIDVKSHHIHTYAGGGGAGWSNLKLHSPSGIAIDAKGNLYVADKGNNAIRKIIPPVKPSKIGTIITIAGLGPTQPGCAADGLIATEAPLTHPQDVAVDAAGNVYIADSGCRKIRKISPDGKITTIAGTGADHTGTPPEVPFSASSGAALQVNLSFPIGIALDKAGNLLISDLGFDVVWFYNASKSTVQVLAGLAPQASVCATATNPEGDGCHGDSAFLNIPGKPAINASGDIYIPERGGTMNPSHPFDVRVLKPIGP